MKLIDKYALVAEIERRLEEYRTYPDYQIDSNYMELCDILSFLDTLEVKEVDLEEEIGNLVCPIYGESVGIAILGANKGKKAPYTMNGDLCDSCKEKYIIVVEVENETNPKPTGRYVYVPKELINVDCPKGEAIMTKEDFSKTFNNK